MHCDWTTVTFAEWYGGKSNGMHGSLLYAKMNIRIPTNEHNVIQLIQANPNNLLTSTEATEVFFGVTKLFMSEDASLRRMVYLFIKEVAETCNPDDVIIVTSSLTKDMTCDVDLYRANALRVLSRIIDTGMLGAIERYVKSAIVDSSAQVASAALVSSLHLLRSGGNPNLAIIKRWISEITTASSITSSVNNASNPMVQFHAYVLLYQLKKGDKLGIRKLVQTAAATSSSSSRNTGTMSPLTKVLMIRYTLSLMSTLPPSDDEWRTVHYPYLESLLRDKSEMVVFEAARGICSLPNISAEDLMPAIHALQLFLSSPKPSIRFASIKTLANLVSQDSNNSSTANSYTRSVSKCNEDLEALIGDSNRNISTYAISTLLKTGSESSMERYLKQISGLLSEIGDEFKIQIVHSIQNLCVVYPHKYGTLLAFLANFLRDEGGFEFKASIVRSMEYLMRSNVQVLPQLVDTALLHLCEFIEDCEFVQLSTHVLALLGELGPYTEAPSRYIRFIYNRVILEQAAIRAAAVSALIQFGANANTDASDDSNSSTSLRHSVLVLLKACVCDEDDEVRDRATLGIHVLQSSPTNIRSSNDEDAEYKQTDESDKDNAAAYLYGGGMNASTNKHMPMTLDALELSLQRYALMESHDNDSTHDQDLTFDSLPIVEVSAMMTAASAGVISSSMDTTATTTDPIGMAGGVSASSAASASNKKEEDAAVVIYNTPELAGYGSVFRTTASVDLTERETEYYVCCVKHVLTNAQKKNQHIILQFNILNTLEDQRLRNVRVELTGDVGMYVPVAEVPADVIRYGDTGMVFVVLERQVVDEDDENTIAFPTEQFDCELKFAVQMIDPEDNANEEENDVDVDDLFDEDYPLESLSICPSDFMAKTSVLDFRKSWESLGKDHPNNGNEVLEKFALKQCKTVQDAVKTVLSQLGMHPCDGTDIVNNVDASKKPHMIHLTGSFIGNVPVMARAQMGILDQNMVLKIAVRSTDANVSRLVANSIQ